MNINLYDAPRLGFIYALSLSIPRLLSRGFFIQAKLVLLISATCARVLEGLSFPPGLLFSHFSGSSLFWRAVCYVRPAFLCHAKPLICHWHLPSPLKFHLPLNTPCV